MCSNHIISKKLKMIQFFYYKKSSSLLLKTYLSDSVCIAMEEVFIFTSILFVSWLILEIVLLFDTRKIFGIVSRPQGDRPQGGRRRRLVPRRPTEGNPPPAPEIPELDERDNIPNNTNQPPAGETPTDQTNEPDNNESTNGNR